MNREKKYKAWHKKDKKWIDLEDDYYALDNEGDLVCFYTSCGELMIDAEYHAEIVFNTGLKDKNGTEIYEGDIGDWHGRKFKVMFEYGCFVMRSIDEEDYVNGFHENCEIIGNVFEHSHLLEESK